MDTIWPTIFGSSMFYSRDGEMCAAASRLVLAVWNSFDVQGEWDILGLVQEVANDFAILLRLGIEDFTPLLQSW